MRQTKLNEFDQKLVDEYVLQESIKPRKKFRPWTLCLWLFVIVSALGVISRIVSYLALEV